MQSFGGPFNSEITWLQLTWQRAVTEGSVFFLLAHWSKAYSGEVYDVGDWIQFGRDFLQKTNMLSKEQFKHLALERNGRKFSPEGPSKDCLDQLKMYPEG